MRLTSGKTIAPPLKIVVPLRRPHLFHSYSLRLLGIIPKKRFEEARRGEEVAVLPNIIGVFNGSKKQSDEEAGHVVPVCAAQDYHESSVDDGDIDAMNVRPEDLEGVSGVLHGPHHEHDHHEGVAVEVEVDEGGEDRQEDDREQQQPGQVRRGLALVDLARQFGSGEVREGQLEGEEEPDAAEVEDGRDGPPQRELEEGLRERVGEQVGVQRLGEDQYGEDDAAGQVELRENGDTLRALHIIIITIYPVTQTPPIILIELVKANQSWHWWAIT